MIKKVFFCFLFLLAFHFAEKFCHRATDGFTIAGLTSNVHLAYDTLGSEEEAAAILSQPFTYLGSGGQSFAFASEDGKYVLKFFNNHPKSWIPLPKYQAKKMEKLRKAYSGYRLAFNEFKEESGLVFLHLNKSHFHAPQVTLVDKLNITHQLDLNAIEFVIQKRAELVRDYMQKYPYEAIHAIKQLNELLCEKNIQDTDPRFYRNMGFIEGKAVLIDPGNCVIAYGRKPKLPLKFITWVEANFPELSKEIL